MNANLELQHHLDALQDVIGRGNAERGFHEEGDGYRRHVANGSSNFDVPLRNYYALKVSLIHTELSEAIEELRAGHAADHVYHSEGGKPEGFMVEIVDAVVRCFDLADEVGVSLGALLLEKLSHNSTRGRLHGGKSF